MHNPQNVLRPELSVLDVSKVLDGTFLTITDPESNVLLTRGSIWYLSNTYLYPFEKFYYIHL